MDVASLSIGMISLIVSLAGFTIAVIQIRKTRSAAEHAAEAADAARDSVLQITSIADLTQASAQIDQLKELHRSQELGRAIDRYTPLRQLLTVARTRLPEEKAEVFDGAIRQLIIMETEATEALAEQRTVSERQINRTLLDMQQALDEARVELEQFLTSTSDVGRQ